VAHEAGAGARHDHQGGHHAPGRAHQPSGALRCCPQAPCPPASPQPSPPRPAAAARARLAHCPVAPLTHSPPPRRT
jgi:hypothetical protein